MNLAILRTILKKSIEGMNPFEAVEYAVVAVMAATLPWGWQVSVWMLPLLVVAGVARMVAERRVFNPGLTRGGRWMFWLLMAFGVLQVVSLAYTSNTEEGFLVIFRRLSMFLIPVCLVAGDTTFMNAWRRRSVMYLFTASVVVKFVVRAILMFSTHHGLAFSEKFDPLHHTYMAMYLLFMMGFLYMEWHNRWSEIGVRGKVFVVAALLVSVMYTVMVMSRTGMLGMILLFLFAVVHQFVARRTRRALLLLFAGLVGGGAIYMLLPNDKHRIAGTVEKIRSSDDTDIRVDIYRVSAQNVARNLPFGAGVGDGGDEMERAFAEDGHPDWSNLNAHNIYFDVAIAMGIPGIVLLLAVLVLPVVLSWRRGRVTMLAVFMATVAFCGLFESVLNRQWGVVFFGLFFAVLLAGETDEGAAEES